MRVPCVAHLRDFSSVNFLTKFYAKLIDHHIAISNAIKINLLELGIPEERITLIWDAIDLDDFNLDISNSHLRDEFNINSEEKSFGLFGRIVDWKGVKEFVRASAIVLPQYPNSRAFVVRGSSDANIEYFEEVKKLSIQLGVHDKISFTGYRRDVPEMMSLMDVVVHSSITPEPFGMVLVEGMAVGKPIVATKSGGPLRYCR